MIRATLLKDRFRLLSGLLVALAVLGTASAQFVTEEITTSGAAHFASAPGKRISPASNLQQPLQRSQKFAAHTNFEIFIPAGHNPEDGPPFTGHGYETPGSIACHYGLVTTSQYPACNPNAATVVPTGGSKTIAIVDAYDDPSASGDLAWFSDQFNLPLETQQFQVIWAITNNASCYSTGYVPTDYTGDWEVEESMDIEWAHAMAPGAALYLVEACSNSGTDLQQAVLVANNLVRCGQTEINSGTGQLGTCPQNSTGKGEVSMSWGGTEFIGENANDGCAQLDDSCFTAANVVYFASTGDSSGVIWPGTSPNVVASGGTTLRRSPATFNFKQEAAWVEGGGGLSAIEARPTYQSSISGSVGNWRGIPDLSFDADPNTGAWVYDTFPVEGEGYLEWTVVGGTSLSAPSLAGIVNRAGAFAASSNAELTTIYANKGNSADITDVTAGFCGFYMGFSTVSGWDFCTGVGVVKGYAGK
jgi:kumamolisin